MSKVIVAGSMNMDIVVAADRHPKIGETVFGTDVKFFPGGKGANQAVAAAKSGSTTLMIGKVGKDAFGDQLLQFLGKQGVDLTHVQRSDSPTGTALIVTTSSDNAIVVVPGSNSDLLPEDSDAVELSQGDILISQFEIPEKVIEHFFKRGKEKGATTILNPAPAKECSPSLLALVDILILNETELSFFAQKILDPLEADAIFFAMKNIRCHAAQTVIVTLGKQGVLALCGDERISVHGRNVDVADTTGAGDCFIGVFASQLAAGMSVQSSLEYANCAASLSVQHFGAASSMPTRKEIEQEL